MTSLPDPLSKPERGSDTASIIELEAAMRIVSLTPEATEILQALGLGGVVALTPQTSSHIGPPLPSNPHPPGERAGLKAGSPSPAHRKRGAEGEGICGHAELAAALQAVQPTLIFTSESAAGGVPRATVRRAVSSLKPRPAVYALEPHTLGDILSDIKSVGDATGQQRPARVLIEALRARIDAVTLRSARALADRPPRRVACLMGAEPPIAAGWWLAELVGLAGGLDVLAGLGRPPRIVTWAEVQAAQPDVTVRVGDGAAVAVLPGTPTLASAGPITPGPSTVDLLEQLASLIL